MGAELSTPQAGPQQQEQQEPEKQLTTQESQEPTREAYKAIFERYIEPQGTKIEVQPADVIESADVIKKTKKKKNT
jgi:uncharacterized protein YaiL (DUF2058 family)